MLYVGTDGISLNENTLAAGLSEVKLAPANQGTLVTIVVRSKEGERETPKSCEVTKEEGLVGDRWAKTCRRRLPDGTPNPDSQLTLMNTRMLALLTNERDRWPLAGDNLMVDFDLSDSNLPTGQRLKIGEAIIEITELPHTGCSKFSGRFGPHAVKFVNSPEGKKLRLRGVHARVIQPGRVHVGDKIVKVSAG